MADFVYSSSVYAVLDSCSSFYHSKELTNVPKIKKSFTKKLKYAFITILLFSSYLSYLIREKIYEKIIKMAFFFVDRQEKVMYKSVSSSGSNSAVECNLAKVEVAGSNPVSRSRNLVLIVI